MLIYIYIFFVNSLMVYSDWENRLFQLSPLNLVRIDSTVLFQTKATMWLKLSSLIGQETTRVGQSN